MKLPDRVYDVLKWIGLIALPAIGLAYSQLADVWKWPYGVQVQTTCDIIGVLIGTLIGVSAISINAEQRKQLKEEQNMKELMGESPDGED